MKKLAVVAVMLMVGASMAFASSLAIPWYLDNAPAGIGLQPPAGFTITLIYLKNNASTPTECSVSYTAESGAWLGPDPAKGEKTTFIIEPGQTLLWRPVAKDDQPAVPNGQESPAAALIPDRPRDVDTKKNGSITIRFKGGPSTVQGALTAYFKPNETGAQTVTYSFLLPPGN